jgi:hypothetical protein
LGALAVDGFLTSSADTGLSLDSQDVKSNTPTVKNIDFTLMISCVQLNLFLLF